MEKRFEGILAPVVTPFKPDLAPDPERFVRHCRWLLESGCTGLAVFGTNSEANSLSVAEKIALLAELMAAGAPASRLMPGTGCCALSDSVTLTREAVQVGCGGVLMLPPFYYKGVSDEGLYRYFAEVIERVGDSRLRLYLYHIPALSQIPISQELIERLTNDYPGIVVGIKDSSGDMAHTRAILDRFKSRHFDVFVGSEEFLLENLRAGGKGCISATGNINPGAIDLLRRNADSAEAEKIQAQITVTRKIVQKVPMIPALKAIIAHFASDPGFRTVRPPLTTLTPEQESGLIRELLASGFSMPGMA